MPRDAPVMTTTFRSGVMFALFHGRGCISVRSGLRCAGEQASGEVSSKSLARDHCRGAIPGYITRLSFCARFACWEDDSGVVSGDMLVVCGSSNSINLAIIARVAFKSAIL